MTKHAKRRRFQEPQGLTNAFRRAIRDEALRQQGRCCAYCLEPLKPKAATSDHVDPRFNGGLDRRENIVAACQPCNLAKGHMPVVRFKALVESSTVTAGISYGPMMAWFRRRLNARLALMDQRLAAATGRKPW